MRRFGLIGRKLSHSFSAKYFAEKNITARADILHNAEKMLLEDMPVIPIVFNQTKTLIHNDLSKVVTTYYGTFNFNKAVLKNYQLYVPVEED